MAKNLIIKSSYSMLSNGELKSNFGDLIRSTALLSCFGGDFIWLTDSRAIGLLKWFVSPEKIVLFEDFEKKGLLTETYEIYNIDNYVRDEAIFRQLKGNWHGYAYDSGGKATPENKLIESVTPYVFSNVEESWQQALIEGLGFSWKEQDYSLPSPNTKKSADIGLNWNVHAEWTSKHWDKKNWEELEKLLKEDYSVSWQQGLDNFDEYVNWINSCDVIITCDTLGMHLASALRKKVIAIVGPTESREFSYGRITFAKPKHRECMPCNSPKCKFERNCVSEISPQEIKKIVAGLKAPHGNLEIKAKELRKKVLELGMKTGEAHFGGSFSEIEILLSLFSRIDEEDKFILSKGHSCYPLYAILQEKGYNPRIAPHPDMDIKNRLFCTTGSLGQGFSMAVGMALARKFKKEKGKIFVLIGDGECQEGIIWESSLIASHHKLDNLTAVVDYNKLQALDKTDNILSLGDLRKKFEAFGWYVSEADGHNFPEIIEALEKRIFGKPHLILAHTVKGKGISYMENDPKWHTRLPTPEELKQAYEELK